MRLGVALFVVVAVMGIAACGGNAVAAPLALEQRVPGEAEAPGSGAGSKGNTAHRNRARNSCVDSGLSADYGN